MKSQELIVVLPFCRRDYGLAVSLLNWISRIGPCNHHDVVLLADIKVRALDIEVLKNHAERAFRKVYTTTTPRSLLDERWPLGPNFMFRTAVSYVRTNFKGQPFYFLEPDCVPLKPDWLEQLDAEYRVCGKPFMGAIVHSSGNPDLPGDHMTGVAIYPANTYDYVYPSYQDDRAFDMAHAYIVVPRAHSTKLHQHFWGDQEILKNPPPGFIREDACLIHRDKAHNIMRYLEPVMNR